MKERCAWVSNDPILLAYHDAEWGVPIHSDVRLFEMLILEGAQAGLSWNTILQKRLNYRLAFDAFDAHRIADYDDERIAQLLSNPGIVRNKLKLYAAVDNARAYLAVKKQFGTFDKYIWDFVDGNQIHNAWKTPEEVPTESALSVAMSLDMKKRGFKFVGPTICYAYMQACGLVNDHIVGCFRHGQVQIALPQFI
jgi:DNA-3-methyladenine glycosylase I